MTLEGMNGLNIQAQFDNGRKKCCKVKVGSYKHNMEEFDNAFADKNIKITSPETATETTTILPTTISVSKRKTVPVTTRVDKTTNVPVTTTVVKAISSPVTALVLTQPRCQLPQKLIDNPSLIKLVHLFTQHVCKLLHKIPVQPAHVFSFANKNFFPVTRKDANTTFIPVTTTDAKTTFVLTNSTVAMSDVAKSSSVPVSTTESKASTDPVLSASLENVDVTYAKCSFRKFGYLYFKGSGINLVTSGFFMLREKEEGVINFDLYGSDLSKNYNCRQVIAE